MESTDQQKRRYQHVLKKQSENGYNSDDELAKHCSMRLSDDNFTSRVTLKHTPLRNARHIRMISLLPGGLGDEIRCQMHEIDPETVKLDYAALSYAWGTARPVLPIVCNGTIANLSVNLYSALLRLRLRFKDKHVQRIWIDALCIDQRYEPAALEERATQVRRMSDIYSQAKLVVVDLGGSNEIEAHLIGLMLEAFRTTPMNEFRESLASKTRIPKIEHHLSTHGGWPPYFFLVQRTWFRRVWVVQEFVLADEIELYLGALSINFALLAEFFAKTECYLATIMEFTRSNRPTWRQYTMKPFTTYAFIDMTKLRDEVRHRGRRPSLPWLLNFARKFEATDPRDYVYGILALAETADSENFDIDYQESLEAFETRLNHYLVRRGYGMSCLSQAQGIHCSRVSWHMLRLWTRCVTEISLEYLSIDGLDSETIFPGIYHAGGTEQAEISLVTGSEMLAIRGYRIDTVDLVSRPCPPFLASIRDGSFLRDTILWCFAVSAWVNEVFKDKRPADVRECFYRTLLSDRAPSTTSDTIHGNMVLKRMSATDPDMVHRLMELLRPYTGAPPGAMCTLSASDYKPFTRSGSPWSMACFNSCMGKRICRTVSGRMALVPTKTVSQNEIWIFPGVPVPFVLRRLGEVHVLVGKCYVHGMMDGEIFKSPNWRDKVETVYLK